MDAAIGVIDTNGAAPIDTLTIRGTGNVEVRKQLIAQDVTAQHTDGSEVLFRMQSGVSFAQQFYRTTDTNYGIWMNDGTTGITRFRIIGLTGDVKINETNAGSTLIGTTANFGTGEKLQVQGDTGVAGSLRATANLTVGGASWLNGDAKVSGLLTAIKACFGPQSVNNVSNGSWNPIANPITGGKCLWEDEEFAGGTNGVTYYNNSSATATVVTRVADATAPNASGQVLQIAYDGSGNASPGLGGFVQTIQAAQNRIFVQRFRAKIPVGYSVYDAQNSMGTNGQCYWLTSQAGTGKYEDYIRVVLCGDSGSFSGGGHVYLQGPAGAYTIYLASCTAFDVTARQIAITKNGGSMVGDLTSTAGLATTSSAQFAISHLGGILSSSKYYASLLVGNSKSLNASGQFGYTYDSVTPANSFFHLTPYGAGEGTTFKVDTAGNLTLGGTLVTRPPVPQGSISNITGAPISIAEVYATQGAPSFTPAIHQKTTINGVGYRQHISLGSYRTGASSWSGGFYVGLGGNDANPTEYFLLNYGGELTHSSGSTFLHTNNLANYTGAKNNPYFTGHLGINNTAAQWVSGASTIAAGSYAAFGQGRGGNCDLVLSWNAPVTSGSASGSGYTYRITGDIASAYEQNGNHRWYVTPTPGTAGNPIAFNAAMTLNTSGNLLLNTQADDGSGSKLQVNGSGRLYGTRPIMIDPSIGAVTMKGNPSGWAMGLQFQGSGGTNFGGFYGYGSSDTCAWYTIGDSYNSGWLTVVRGSGATLLGTTVDDGVSRLQVNGTAKINNGNFYVSGNTLLGGATGNYNNSNSALTVNYAGGGSQYGIVLKPGAPDTNAITFLASGSTYASATVYGAIQHNSTGMNLAGTTWAYSGSEIVNRAYLDPKIATLAPLSNAALVKPTIKGYIEQFQALNPGAAVTVNPDSGTLIEITTTANITITLPAAAAGLSYTLIIAYGGAHTVTFAGGSTIKWQGGTAPTATSVSGKYDKYVFTCGSTYTLAQDGGRNF